ncbi:MAG: pyridoxal phosphate-dependent aminotransferase, partial [Candidatus Eisenbacteria bacterium]|nr:pyridoxal phosphate-dependent aminotransferase [Candidatus Eisenbacteria bacterium]MBI3539352.1 pyridoxal phosphate-dependent aminotransferase [Candidatus Eisenbacteria bacterium]
MTLSRRIPGNEAPNAWARLLAGRRAAGAALIDLTEANPTRVGLAGGDAATLAAPADPAAARYEPDPRGSRRAREAVAGYYAGRGLPADPEAILLTTGTSESYAHLFRLLGDPGDTFLIPAPSYPLFEPIAALEGVRLRPYRIAWDGGWHLDRGSLETAFADGARGMIVVQPNHPTGSCLDSAEVAFAEALCERHGTALISDEVFGDFAWPATGASVSARGPGAASGAVSARGLPSLLGARRVVTFVLSGLSKVCGMPQMKLGWIALAGPEAARAEALRGLEWIADLFLSVGTPVQHALPALLESRHAWQPRVLERIAANRARLGAATARYPAFEVRAGVGGWVAPLRVPATRGEEDWVLELIRRGVVAHPGHFYDAADEPLLVVSLIVEPDRFAAGLDVI